MKNLQLLKLCFLVLAIVVTTSCNDDETCNDGILNQDETNIDCGGVCTACPTCTDGIQNGSETDIDCGGTDCAACPTCTDGIQNGNETDIDCGGTDCAACTPDFESIIINKVWDLTDFNYSGSATESVYGIATTYTGEGMNFNFIAEFNENPMEYSMSGTYDVFLHSIAFGLSTYQTIPVSDLNGITSGSWSIADSTITFSANGESIDYEIETLTDSRLEISFDLLFNQVENGVTITQDLEGFVGFDAQ